MDFRSLNEITTKISSSGCLNDQEFEEMQKLSTKWKSLLSLDQLDRAWQAEVKKHVCYLLKLGIRHLPVVWDSAFCGGCGIALIGHGLYLFYQHHQGISLKHFNFDIAAGEIALGVLLLVWAAINFRNSRRFQPVLKAYEESRRPALAMLPINQRPGTRFCLKCMEFTEAPASLLQHRWTQRLKMNNSNGIPTRKAAWKSSDKRAASAGMRCMC